MIFSTLAIAWIVFMTLLTTVAAVAQWTLG